MDKELLPIFIVIAIIVGIVCITYLFATGKITNVDSKWIKASGGDTNKSSKNDDTAQNIKRVLEVNLQPLFDNIYMIFRTLMRENHILSRNDNEYAAYKNKNIQKIHNLLRDNFEYISNKNYDSIKDKTQDYFSNLFDEIKRITKDFEAVDDIKLGELLSSYVNAQLEELEHHHTQAENERMRIGAIREHAIALYEEQVNYIHPKVRGFIFRNYREFLEKALDCEVKTVGSRNG